MRLWRWIIVRLYGLPDDPIKIAERLRRDTARVKKHLEIDH